MKSIKTRTLSIFSKQDFQQAQKELVTIRDFIRFAVTKFNEAKLFYGHGTATAFDEAVNLILHTLNLPYEIDPRFFATKILTTEKHIVLNIIQKRIKERKPAPYLTNQAFFAGLEFFVDERVLIPRSPLAEIIEKQFTPWVQPEKVQHILDIGTGSGCIAIACAYAFPNAKIDAIDVSNEALEVAKYNCTKHHVIDNVRLIKSDLFSKLATEKYDIIIANPPYVGEKEWKSLPQEYQHEPKQALLAGREGDEIIIKILQEAANHLSSKGILLVEVGNSEQLIIQKYPHLPFTWLEFERGAAEVFLLTAEQLQTAAKK